MSFVYYAIFGSIGSQLPYTEKCVTIIPLLVQLVVRYGMVCHGTSDTSSNFGTFLFQPKMAYYGFKCV